MTRSIKILSFAAILAVGLPWAASAQPQELPLGSKIPGANLMLKNTSGADAGFASVKGEQGTVLLFWSNDCPWVDKYEERVLRLASQYEGQGISFVMVNSNDPVAFSGESMEQSRARAEDRGYPNYLLDGGSRLATALGASRTPHVFVFDADDTLVYVGTIDDSPGDPSSVQNTYLKDALDAVVQGGHVETAKTKAFGCTLKFQ